MIAFKPFMSCPPDQRPEGIPLSYPWIQAVCTEEEQSLYKSKGYTVLSEEDYQAYLDNNQTDIDYYRTYILPQNNINNVTKTLLIPAATFGQSLIYQFASENILLGITQLNMTATVRANTAGIVAALSTGSLYDAIAQAKALPVESKDDRFITDARLLVFVNKIETYLGMPLSLTLY